MKNIIFVVASLWLSVNAMAANGKQLALDVYNAGPSSFHVNSTLVVGETEVMVVDTGFTKADALRIAAKVLDTGKPLKTIFISQADPDYYFGAEVLHSLFPDAKVLTTAAVKKVIDQKLQGKLNYWGPKLGSNAPVSPYMPEVINANTMVIDGHTIEIHGTEGKLAHRPYLWIPSVKAVLGNVAVFGDLHLWMADTQSETQIRAWVNQLNKLKSMSPEIVIPGHMKSGSTLNSDSIDYSLQYLTDFVAAKAGSKNSEELINKMSTLYPSSLLPIALNIGAKVHMGEMKC